MEKKTFILSGDLLGFVNLTIINFQFKKIILYFYFANIEF